MEEYHTYYHAQDESSLKHNFVINWNFANNLILFTYIYTYLLKLLNTP